MLGHTVGRSEAQLAVTKLIGNAAQVGVLRMQQDHQVVPRALLVPQKEVLAVRRVDLSPVLLGFVHGRDRRMLVPFERDSQFLQSGVDRTFAGYGRWMMAHG